MMITRHIGCWVKVRIELLDAQIGLLLGGSSLDAADAALKCGKLPFITLPNALGDGIKIPLTKKESGHYVFPVYPPTPEDDKKVASSSLEENSWSKLRSQLTIPYVTKDPDPKYEPLLCQKVLTSTIQEKGSRKRGLNMALIYQEKI